MDNSIIFYDRDALIYRLHEGLEDSSKELVFVVGAPLTAPQAGSPGVADVAAVESLDWETAATKYKQFDGVVGAMVGALDQLGDWETADGMLRRYEATIPEKTARYIAFCDTRAYSYWMRGQFEDAVEWAQRGVLLKQETNVDTAFDCAHTLALAQRDSGHPEEALKHFLRIYSLEEIVSGAKRGPKDGPLYGNVGRYV